MKSAKITAFDFNFSSAFAYFSVRYYIKKRIYLCEEFIKEFKFVQPKQEQILIFKCQKLFVFCLRLVALTYKSYCLIAVVGQVNSQPIEYVCLVN